MWFGVFSTRSTCVNFPFDVYSVPCFCQVVGLSQLFPLVSLWPISGFAVARTHGPRWAASRGLGECGVWTVLFVKVGPFSWVAVAASEAVEPPGLLASGLSPACSSRDGSTQSECPLVC